MVLCRLSTPTDQPRPRLDIYIADCLPRAIAAAGLVRNLPACAHFLQVTTLSDGKTNNRVREGGVTGYPVDYPESPEGTLHTLHEEHLQMQRRIVVSPERRTASIFCRRRTA